MVRRGNAHCVRQGLSRPTWRERRAPALWRRGEVQLDRLAAGARARLDGEFLRAGLEDQRCDPLSAVDADPGAEHPAARAVTTRLVRCQPETLAHHASTLAAARRPRLSHDAADNYAFGKHVIIIVTPLAGQAGSRGALEDYQGQCFLLSRERRLHRAQKRPNPKQGDPNPGDACAEE